MRYRSLSNLIEQARLGLKYRKRLGLVGPVVSDHPEIEKLLSGLRQMGAGFSLSSLRVSPLSITVIKELVRGGAKTITLAPEAGSQRLRQVIGKGITENDILKAVAKVAGQGLKQLKLYFMIGLPSENDADIDEMITLALKCKDILDRGKAGCRLSLNIAPFVPKAGTPFQWLPMADLAALNRSLALLKKQLTPKGIKVRSESLTWSHIQGALARAKWLSHMGHLMARFQLSRLNPIVPKKCSILFFFHCRRLFHEVYPFLTQNHLKINR